MSEYKRAVLAFLSWYIEQQHGRTEYAEEWYNRFSCLMDLIEYEYTEALEPISRE